MRAYELRANDQTICAIDIETPSWLPVRPRVNAGWLRFILASALRRYFGSPAVVKAA